MSKDSDSGLTGAGKIERAVVLAGKVGKPLTFFAAMGFILVGLIPTLYWTISDQPSIYQGIALAVVAFALPVDIVCVLVWAKAKIAQNPNAFDDE